jgi:hypothetical protein
MTTTKLLTAAAIAMSLTATPAMADCTARDLAGRWAAFAYGNTTATDINLARINGCRVFLNNRGRFASESRCPGSDLRGRFEVSNSCVIAGIISQRFGAGGRIDCGISAAATASHEMISGIGACDNGDILIFNMVRR